MPVLCVAVAMWEPGNREMDGGLLMVAGIVIAVITVEVMPEVLPWRLRRHPVVGQHLLCNRLCTEGPRWCDGLVVSRGL